MTELDQSERERTLVDTFVELSDTLVDDFDPLEFLHRLARRTVELGLAAQTGILLRDRDGELQVMAASEEEEQMLELLQTQSEEGGPCTECVRRRESVSVDDLDAHRGSWPRFVEVARSLGLRSIHAVPLQVRGHVIGAMNLLHEEPGPLSAADRSVARGLAQVAAVGLVQEQTLTESRRLTGQLQRALDSRVLIEQAKGVIAQQSGLGMGPAFELLRARARASSVQIHELARQIIDGRVTAADLRRR